MSLNILDLIRGQLGPALVTQAATQLGESESGISKAISGLLPAVVGGFANHSSNPTVLDSITGSANSGLLGNLLGGSANNTYISNVLASIFGDKLAGIINAISGYAGIGTGSTSTLLNMVTGATLGSVGKYAADNNLDRSAISGLLSDQKGIVSTLLPAGLSMASLGLGDWFGDSYSEKAAATATTAAATEPHVEVTRAGATHVNVDRDEVKTEGSSIWKWLLPLLLLLLVGWFLMKQCDNKETVTTTDSDSTVIVEDSANVMVDTTMTTADRGEMTAIDLNGTPLQGYANGMESRMIEFLRSGGYTNAADDEALKTTWYDFDNVNFQMGSATALEPGSEGQIQNLAEILKAYPDAKIKIGGYTDKTGDAATNKKLSQDRADFIKSELTKLGVGAQVTGAEGYGSEQAVVDASASDAERAKDRKMSVRFTK
ncbi:OmpA family protein [Kaistella sp. PBT33-4]|uniref:OmpA family protein n=1 Tax=Kaistella sp. PBT33-4 TaxID=3032000 RepID=UPI0023D88D8B|nr:OmpA family protein [Kaistella sp. PBT33-4]MDF0719942.1 OmpA family protein [Kaistella sp. PBT33-4]